LCRRIKKLPAKYEHAMVEESLVDGYVVTFVSGEAIQENGHETGARPGKVVRGVEARGL
jgi:N-acyl-D-aspartate/D-glutamate deacylase